MPIHRVQGEDGKIHKIEAPADATPQEIEAYAAENIKPQAAPEKPLTQYQAYTAAALKSIPFGTDIGGALGAAIYGGESDKPFIEKQRMAKQELEKQAALGEQQYPVTSTLGNIATAVPTAIALTPAKLLQAPTVAARAIKGGLAAAGLGALYGAGEGNTIKERASNAITRGITDAPMGIFGSLGADVIGAGYQGVRNLSGKAASLFGQNLRQAQGVAIDVQPAGLGLDDVKNALISANPKSTLSMDTIPLTKGQATQNAAQQSLEYGAQAGAYGQEAQKMALEARELQSQAAKNVLSDISGSPISTESPLNAANNLISGLKQSYASAKAKTNLAYKNVRDLTDEAGKPLMVAGEYVRSSVLPSIKEWKRNGNSTGFDLTLDGMQNAKKLYDRGVKIADNPKITALNFFRMEQWRGSVSSAIANSKTPAEKAFLSGMLQRYDTAMQQLPREAVKSGDYAILDAMEKARGARKAQGVLFERSKIVKDVLTNENLTNEQFYNTISSLGAGSGSYVRDILRTAANEPAKQAALRQQIKQSVIGSVLNKSMLSEVSEESLKSGKIDKLVSFDKLATNLEKFVNNKTLFNQVVANKAEQEALKDVLRKATLIKSAKPGTRNYSNTAYTLLNVLTKVSPSATSANVFGMGAGSALKAMGEAGAEQELSQSLAPVLKGIVDENKNVLTNFGEKYGRQVMIGGGAGLRNKQETGNK